MNNKPISEYTIEELEKLELQLWRSKNEYQIKLDNAINDLNIITNILLEKVNKENVKTVELE